MSLAVVLLIVALICFVVAAFGALGRVNLVPLGLACWVLAILLAGGHVAVTAAHAPGAAVYTLAAAVLPVAVATASTPAVDAATFNLISGLVVGAACSYLLKWAPASWKGKPMAIAAMVAAAALEMAELYVTGQLQTFNIFTAADVLAALAGLNAFYNLLKDNLHLQDPPGSGTSPAIAAAPKQPPA